MLDGARFLTVGGHYAYVMADAGLVIVDLDDPMKPKHVTTMPLNDPRSAYLQFRYLFVTDANGLKVVDMSRSNQTRDNWQDDLTSERTTHFCRSHLRLCCSR